ncbi:MAG: amino acid/polyamine/organocation transporter, superfamily [Actinomycetia bacterium]|nr:amino acid/polyamine/organocation transporter, superfamily [Actinomycetes bacterium]
MVAMPKPAGTLDGGGGRDSRQPPGRRAGQPDPFWYTAKTKLLGPPLVNEQLGEQRLSKPLALGVLSPDGISSSAYGTEEILIALLPIAGLAAFTLILPMTLVILLVMILVVLSYREIVMVYIRPGGSYVVARENFGPRIAQICAVALLIDYVVTVAVQVAAGTAAVASAIPAIGPYKLEICIGVVLLMCYGNMRGLKEAGRAFAVPTYLFAGSVILMIVVGLIREAIGNLQPVDPHTLHGTYTIGAGTAGIVSVAMIFTLLRAFANGGASLTGIEAVSDAVGAFNPPEGRNARQVLITEGLILGILVAGISWLAHATHATPRIVGYPTVLAQEAQQVFGYGFLGHALFLLVQLATMLILYTGANTSFNGFPFLTSYVAGDSFLPRWLLKRGHRLVFSNAIILLTVTAVALLIIKDADVNSLVPLYAIGVFTAFSMAGFGMAKYHHTRREPGWRPKFIINFSAGVLTLIVVIIFAVVKFTEGAWVVLVLFAIFVPALIRLNAEYRDEAEVLETVTGEQPPPAPHYSRRVVFVFVDSFDLATLAALRYARSLRPTQIRAVHFVIDSLRAEKLRDKWMRADRGVALDFIDCPDRRLIKAATDLAEREIEDPGTHVTVILPRRSYSPLLGRLLHDRTADKIAAAVSRIPRSAATIVPYDVPSRVAVLQARQAAAKAGRAGKVAGPAAPAVSTSPTSVSPTPVSPTSASAAAVDLAATAREMARESDVVTAHSVPVQSGNGTTPGLAAIGTVTGGKVTVEGKVRVVEIRPVERNSVLAVEINDSTGNLTAMFYGRSHIPGLICGARVRFTGSARIRGGQPVMINPAYELVSHGEEA